MTKTESPASYLERYLDPFRDLLLRDDVVEIAINPDGKVWLEVAGDATMRHKGQTVDCNTALNMAQTIVGDAKARVSEKNPLVSGKVEYAGRPLRVQVAVPPAIEKCYRAGVDVRMCTGDNLQTAIAIAMARLFENQLFTIVIIGIQPPTPEPKEIIT